jgi:signal transduction histidine kinase
MNILDTPTDLQGKKILLVDDNPTNLGVIADYLGEQGFTILIARDGQSALEKADFAHPDIILLDVMMPGLNGMPGMDGFETCRKLKENPATRPIPVIFMTALAETANKLVGFQAGAVDYVTKPIQQEEVQARLVAHLRLRELTERLEALVQQRTAELEQAYQRLERLDQAKSDFISVVSHELRTPLTIIDGYTQVLKEEPLIQQQEHLKKQVGSVLVGTARMLEIINLVVDATRLDQGGLALHPEPLSLHELAAAAVHHFRQAIEKRRLQVSLDGLDESLEIVADPDLLRRMLIQLLSNAIKYTPDGGTINVSGQAVSGADGQPEVEIVVSDSGIGVNPADQELIFEKFYRAEKASLHTSSTTSFKGGGPGLGLSIVRGIVQAHGGRAWVESPGRDEQACPGSRFIVRLPC